MRDFYNKLDTKERFLQYKGQKGEIFYNIIVARGRFLQYIGYKERDFWLHRKIWRVCVRFLQSFVF